MNYFNIYDTEFGLDDIDDQMIGAGILPVATDINGNIHFLLGKERYIHHWKGSMRWSGFEGGRKPHESIEETAAREFFEESMGVVPLGKYGEYQSQEEVCDMLRQNKFVCKLILCIRTDPDLPLQKNERLHVTYLVETKFSKEYPIVFNAKRMNCLSLQQKIVNMQKMKEYFQEYNMPIDNIHWAGANVKQVTEIIFVNETEYKLKYIDDEHNLNTIRIHASFLITLYFNWFQSKSDVLKDILDIVSKNKKIIDISEDILETKCNEDYLEKECINWWSIESLYQVLKNGGSFEKEQFRAYFLPVLWRYLNEVTLYKKKDGVTLKCKENE